MTEASETEAKENEAAEQEKKTSTSEGQKYDGGDIPKVSPPEKKKK